MGKAGSVFVMGIVYIAIMVSLAVGAAHAARNKGYNGGSVGITTGVLIGAFIFLGLATMSLFLVGLGIAIGVAILIVYSNRKPLHLYCPKCGLHSPYFVLVCPRCQTEIPGSRPQGSISH